MNILTFDIEEWSLEKDYFGNNKQNYIQYDRLLDIVLEQLDVNNVTATFFCLGKIATDFPDVIKKIVSAGHEVGSHSNAHKWVNKMTVDEFREDTYSAIAAIEDVAGTKVKSFRAPAFSIGESNKWAFEVMCECGITNDASVFPEVRDFGGFPQFKEQKPCIIDYNGCKINEFPIPIYSLPIINRGLAYSGGGYFRLLPLLFVKKQMMKRDYNMCYFHIADLMADKMPLMTRKDYESYFKENGSLSRRLLRYLKSNIGRRRALNNLIALIESTSFISIRDFLGKSAIQNTITI